MENLGFWLLPLLTVLVVVVSYQMNLSEGESGKKQGAFHEACWWGGGFFVYGVIDYLLLGINTL